MTARDERLPAPLVAALEATRTAVADLEAELSSVLSATAEGPDDEHDPEGATVGFERQRLASLLDAARGELERLEEAAGRVREGSYGICSECGGPIGAARLEALPSARECVGCSGRAGRRTTPPIGGGRLG